MYLNCILKIFEHPNLRPYKYMYLSKVSFSLEHLLNVGNINSGLSSRKVVQILVETLVNDDEQKSQSDKKL